VPGLLLLGFTGLVLDEDSAHSACDVTMTAVQERFAVELEPAELSGRFTLALMEILRGEGEPGEPAEFIPLFEAAPDVFGGLMVTLGFAPTAADKAWFAKRYRADLREHARLHRDAASILPRLARAGLRLGIVTDADPRLVSDIVDATPLGPLVALRVTASDTGHVKPHPAGYEKALRDAGMTPLDAVAAGASFERDIRAAQAAGIERVVLVDRYDARTVDVPRVKTLAGLARAVRDWG
jgi:FMN phosphatase YigB (HAD superfamily)